MHGVPAIMNAMRLERLRGELETEHLTERRFTPG